MTVIGIQECFFKSIREYCLEANLHVYWSSFICKCIEPLFRGSGTKHGRIGGSRSSTTGAFLIPVRKKEKRSIP